jgi:hypothetical protein
MSAIGEADPLPYARLPHPSLSEACHEDLRRGSPQANHTALVKGEPTRSRLSRVFGELLRHGSSTPDPPW